MRGYEEVRREDLGEENKNERNKRVAKHVAWKQKGHWREESDHGVLEDSGKVTGVWEKQQKVYTKTPKIKPPTLHIKF